ncbi:MAG: rhodanese-like domain-containing protein [Hyphomicrobiales bacterium]|nr:rhodanese-like domain-containing protein [Hyphomicrobiales bacterium]
MMTIRVALAGAVAAIIAAVIYLQAPRLAPPSPSMTLEQVENTVEALYKTPQITPEELARRSGDRVLLFDVREKAEYDESHIAGAIHTPPDMSAETFAALHGPALKGATVVFYCSVGVRSSQMMNRVRAALEAGGATAAHNLRGGVFRWAAEARPLVSDKGPTATAHPFNEAWGALLQRTLEARDKHDRGV